MTGELIVLCSYAISNDCPGGCSVDQLWRDEDGCPWDVCRWCHEAEAKILAEQRALHG